MKQLYVTILIMLSVLLLGLPVWSGPGGTTYQAKIIKPDGVPLEASSVNFKFTILDPFGSCILYSETFSGVNMTATGGLISFSLGTGIKTYPVSSTTFENVFSNSTPSLSCDSGGPVSYSPLATDIRKIVMQFHDGSGWQTLPAMAINAVPYAMYASESQKLSGLAASDFVQVSTVPTCATSEALRYTGAGFSCVAVGGGGGGSVTSGSVISALGYTPADGASVTAVTSTVASLSAMVSGLVSATNLQSLNGSTSGTQSFAIGTGGIAPAFNTSNGIHTLNLPYASAGATTAGLISNSDYLTFSNKMNATSAAVINALGYTPASSTALGSFLEISNNLSDIASAAVARINLGLGLLATKSQIDLSSTDVSGTLSSANLPDTGVTATTYTKVTVDSKGRVTSGSQFTASDVAAALGYTPADEVYVTNLSSTVAASFTTVTSNINSVSSSVSSLATSTAASFAAITPSQWATSGANIYYNVGNVGIGTTNPTHSIGLGGETSRSVGVSRRTAANSNGNNLLIEAGGATSGATDKSGGNLVLSSGFSTGQGSSIIQLKTAAVSGTGIFDNTPTTRMQIDGYGNTTIMSADPNIFGNDSPNLIVTNPQSKFTFGRYGGINRFASGHSDGVTEKTLYMTGIGSVAADMAGLNIQTSNMNVTTGGTSRLYMSGLGNIGIGTTAPFTSLDVNGRARALSGVVVGGSAGSLVNGYIFRVGALNVCYNADCSTQRSFFTMNDASNYTNITSKVGINFSNATAPLASLHVSNQIGGDSDIRLTNSTIGNTATDGLYFLESTSGNTTIRNYESGTFTIGTGAASSALTIDSSGNVGIGTTTPFTKFSVSGGVQISMESAACAVSYAGTLRYNSGGVDFCNGSAWTAFGTGSVTSASVISALGYTPADAVNVTNLSSTVATSFTTLTNNINSVSSSVSSLATSTAASFAGLTSSQWNTSGTTINYMSGNVGIATSSPQSKLDVNGVISSNGIYSRSGNTTASLFGGDLTVDDRLDAGDGYPLWLQAGAPAGSSANTNGGTMDIVAGYSRGTGNSEIRFSTSTAGVSGASINPGTVKMLIKGNGNVGIGTPTPITKLEVSGGVRISMESAACTASYTGTLRYSGVNVEFCNGSNWAAFGVASSGITSLGGSTSQTQTFAFGTVGVTPGASTANGVHTFNFPLASTTGVVGGLLSFADYTTFRDKVTSSAGSIQEILGYIPASATALGNYLVRGQNLSDLTNVATARNNLGLGGFATVSSLNLSTNSATGVLAAGRFPALTGDVTTNASSLTTTVASLRGVNLSTTLPTVSGQVLSFDGSQWIPATLDALTAGQNNSMFSGWPDAIVCSDGTNTRVGYYTLSAGGITTYRALMNNVNDLFVQYNSSGAYSANIAMSSYDCVTNAWSITQLRNLGKTFNFAKGPAGQWLASGTITYLNSGNVGIGTTSPETKLHVASSTILLSNNYFLQGENTVGTNSNLIGRNNIDEVIIGDPAFNNPTRIFSGNNYITLETSGSERVRVAANGNVGIGTSTPAATLEVSGTVKISGGSPGAGKVLTSDATGNATWQTAGSGGTSQIYGQLFTANGTFTTPAGTTTNTRYKITIVGGGGGAASVEWTSCGCSTCYSAGTDGGNGGGAIYYGTGYAAGISMAITVGAAGNDDSAGAFSRAVVSGVTITANGGGPGTADTAGTDGTATNGTYNVTGGMLLGGRFGAGGRSQYEGTNVYNNAAFSNIPARPGAVMIEWTQ